MADRSITALPEATTLASPDLFVLSQGNQAKSATWQLIIGYLTTALDGHGGINSVDYTAPTSGSLSGTLTINLADGTSENFTITNGKGISSVTKSAAVPPSLIDTYTITYNDNTTYTFTVSNGKSISSIVDKWAVSTSASTEPSTWYDNPQQMTPTNKYEWHYQIITMNDASTVETDKAVIGVYGDTGQDWHVFFKWSAEEPDSDSDMSNVPDNWIGVYSGTSTTPPTTYTSYTWYEYKGEKGNTGTSIIGITKTGSSGAVDTYTVNFSDGTKTTFTVTNGASIQSITKTGTSGLVDTYTVTLTNGDTTTFEVTNGKGISSITEVDVTHAAGHTDVYRINFNDGDTYSFSIYNGSNGSGSVSTVDGIQSVNQDVPLLKFGNGAPTTSTVGTVKQRYFDQASSILYICVGVDTSGAETTYTWQGTGVTVDSALSTMSTNPVQNAVLTAIIGTATLSTTAQTLTGAVNELKNSVDNHSSAINDLQDITGDGVLTDFTATDLTGAANELKNTLNQKAAKVDLTNINQTSPNCTVTNGIAKGTYFYLDGVLTRAIEAISENAPFTSSNCETVTAGGLNSLKNTITNIITDKPLGNDKVIVTQKNGIVNVVIDYNVTNSGSTMTWVNVCAVPQPEGIDWYLFPVLNNTDENIADARIYNGYLWVDAVPGTKNYRGATTYII